jgi:hypothetical protein
VTKFVRALRVWLVAFMCAAGIASHGIAANAQGSESAADFGSPPSSEIPILFNDHHVYTKPDKLRHGRTLVAIVRGNTILVPMRSMFEQTGASVSYDPSTRTVDVSKPGDDVKVSVGKAWVVVNGQERPLDVPPEIYRGVVVVPLRVISEGMGAYVQWVPEKHLVVVRYVEQVPEVPPPTPPPTPRPSVAPTAPPPSPAPSAAAAGPTYEHYVAGDYLVSPKVFNELSPGNYGKRSYSVKGAIEFPIFSTDWEFSADYRHFLYQHNSDFGSAGCTPGTLGCNTVVGSDPRYQPGICPSPDPGCVTTVGYQETGAQSGLQQIYVTAFQAQESDVDLHLAIKVASPRIYIGVGEYVKSYNYLGYPTLVGVGFGAEKLPDLDQPFSLYGSAFYYPHVSGKYNFATSAFLGSLSGRQIDLAYDVWKYEIGGTIALGKNLFIDLGYAGEHANAKDNAPTSTEISSPYVGLGLHF